jgi:glycosyltransferase involved in cell wall biosynthesis
MKWHIVTGEYPPQPGGVSDYTRVVAHGLVAAGDAVHIWAPRTDQPELADRDITVHRMAGRFGAQAIRQLDTDLAAAGAGKLLIQYVPQAFGWKGMNLPFCFWLYARRKLAPTVMFHEVMYPLERGRALRENLLGAVSCMMAALAARAAARIFVATPLWQEILATRVNVSRPSAWLPLPSTIPVIRDEAGVLEVRRRLGVANGILVGHFSSYPAPTRPLLERLIPRALRSNASLSAILIGADSEACRAAIAANAPELASRVHATGRLASADLSRHLAACDLMLQLYPDGACARRTTLIAAIAHGRPVVSTAGRATEALWAQSGAIALAGAADEAAIGETLAEVAADPDLRARYARAAGALYRDRFDVRHTITMLRDNPCGSQ